MLYKKVGPAAGVGNSYDSLIPATNLHIRSGKDV